MRKIKEERKPQRLMPCQNCVKRGKKEVQKDAPPKKVVKREGQASSSLELLGLMAGFDLVVDGFRFLDLALPFGLSHLGLAAEELVVGLAVAATEAVPEGGELTVVVVEVQMVHGVAGGTVDDRAVGDIFTIVDHDGPDVDEHEKSNVGELLQREEEREDVVG